MQNGRDSFSKYCTNADKLFYWCIVWFLRYMIVCIGCNELYKQHHFSFILPNWYLLALYSFRNISLSKMFDDFYFVKWFGRDVMRPLESIQAAPNWENYLFEKWNSQILILVVMRHNFKNSTMALTGRNLWWKPELI